jgi:hypothetical protein
MIHTDKAASLTGAAALIIKKNSLITTNYKETENENVDFLNLDKILNINLNKTSYSTNVGKGSSVNKIN